MTAANPTVITGGTTSLTVNVANSAPASSDVLNFTASASGAGYGYSTTGSLAAAGQRQFHRPPTASAARRLAAGSYTGTVTVTGTNSALAGVALGSGGTADRHGQRAGPRRRQRGGDLGQRLPGARRRNRPFGGGRGEQRGGNAERSGNRFRPEHRAAAR